MANDSQSQPTPATRNPSLISHVSIGSNRFDAAVAFYDQVMPALGARQMLAFPGAVAYGREFPEMWLQTPIDGKPAEVGNGFHLAFFAHDRAEVDAFYKAAVAAGGRDEGAPGPRPQYGDAYYGCFVRDLDGHKIEAAFWDTSVADAGHGHG